MMQLRYTLETKKGRLAILRGEARYYLGFEGEIFGSYDSIPELIDELLVGNTLLGTRGIETERLGIPDNVSGWIKGRRAAG